MYVYGNCVARLQCLASLCLRWSALCVKNTSSWVHSHSMREFSVCFADPKVGQCEKQCVSFEASCLFVYHLSCLC